MRWAIPLEQQEREAKEKLALLRSLAEAGFAQIDQGNGIAVSSRAQLKEMIGAPGQRAALRVKAAGRSGHSGRNAI